MEEFNWINMNIRTLKFLGFWPTGSDVHSFNLYTLYTVISVFVFIGGTEMFQLLDLILVPRNLEAWMQLFYITLAKILACFKAFYLVFHIKVVKRLMSDVNQPLFKLRSVKHRELIRPDLLKWRAAYITFFTLSTATCILLWIIPLLDKSFKDKILPFPAWYPYKFDKSYYPLAYVHQVVGIHFLSWSDSSIDSLIAALMTLTGAQCDILCDVLRNLKEEDFGKNLIKCVEHHKVIVSFAEDVNKFFDLIILGQFFVGSLNFGLSMFVLTLVGPTSGEGFSVLAYVGALMVQLTFYCWFGNELELKILFLGTGFDLYQVFLVREEEKKVERKVFLL